MTLRAYPAVLALALFAGMSLFISSAFAQSATTTATTTPSLTGTTLGVTLTTTPQVAPGQNEALMTLVLLTAGSGNSIQTSSIPLNVTFGGGMTASHLSDCRVRNVTSLTTSLNSSSLGFVSGANTLSLSSPLTVGAGSTVSLAVTCDVAASAPTGGTIALSLTPSQLPATVAGSATSVTPVVGPSLSGGTGLTAGTVTLVQGAAPTPSFIPGVPNTGTGSYFAVLALAAVMGLSATMILRRRLV